MNEHLFEELSRRAAGKRPDEFLLDLPGAERGNSLTTAIARARVQAGVPHFSCNGLRRAMVRKSRRVGVSAEVRFALMGHTADVEADHYDEVSMEEKMMAFGMLARASVERGKVLEFPRAQDAGTMSKKAI